MGTMYVGICLQFYSNFSQSSLSIQISSHILVKVLIDVFHSYYMITCVWAIELSLSNSIGYVLGIIIYIVLLFVHTF